MKATIKKQFILTLVQIASGLLLAAQMTGQTFNTLHSFAAIHTNNSDIWTNLTRAASSSGGRAKSKFLSVISLSVIQQPNGAATSQILRKCKR